MKDLGIVITMAGLSKRFTDAGYKEPKYKLKIQDKTLFDFSVGGFEKYFEESKFLFIARDIADTKLFIEERCDELGIERYEVVILDYTTKGQAETAEIGLNKSSLINDNDPLFVFNIDTFRPNYIFPEHLIDVDGYLEVFEGEGANWSFAKPKNDHTTEVIETAEKKQISNLCSTGLYFFKNKLLFSNTYKKYYAKNSHVTEQYIAPIYNHLIENNYDVHYHLIRNEEVIFCGVPQEYKELLANPAVLYDD